MQAGMVNSRLVSGVCLASAAPRAEQKRQAPKTPRSTVPRAVAAEKPVGTGANGASAALQFDELADLLKMVHDTDIVELDLKSKRFQLSLKKKEALQAEVQVAQAQATAMQPTMSFAPSPAMFAATMPPAPTAAAPVPAAPAPAPASPPPPAALSAPPPAPAVEGVEIMSPMAGTMYRTPGPGEPAFVQEGQRVRKGQVLCIIEAMKLMNEIEAEMDGTLVKFLVENGQAVFPGQPLVAIKP